MESLTLPPAAKTQTEAASNTKSYGALQESSSRPTQAINPNDRSPLLEVHSQKKISDRLDRQASVASFSSSIRNNLGFKSIVQRISSVNSNVKKPNRALSDVALDLMISAEQADFTVWLDEQFTKIDSFYKEKEKEAVERYLMLQDQLFNLREQKISARVAKAQVKPHMLNIPSNPTATKIKKKIARKIDLPSLPASIHNALFSHTKQDHDKQSKLEDEYAEDSEGVSRDYVKRKRDDDRISYTVARRQIKIAIGEFYRSLELLKSYRTLNQTAFRKMTKKFDKMTGRSLQKPYMEKINSAYFCQSEIADDLIRKTEDMFAMYFENGNHKHAVEKLRAKTVPEEHYSEMFITGLSYVTSITTPEAFRSSHRATTDEEAQVPGVQMPPREDDPTTTTTDPGAAVAAGADKPAKSTFSTIATPVIQALSFALRNAHTRDFQRRKDSVGSTESGHNRSKVDSDDDNTDDDDDDDEGGDTSSVRFGADGALRQRDINQTSGHGPTSSSFAQPSSIQWRDQYL